MSMRSQASAPAQRHAGSDLLVECDRGWTLWRVGAFRSAGLPFSRLAALAAEGELALPAGPDRDEALRRAARQAFDDLLGDDRFLAALTWQNPDALRTWAAGYAAGLPHAGDAGGPRSALHRLSQRQAVISRYAQRYAAKNDTIGFFGPVAWARIGSGPSRQRGTGNLRSHGVFFEVWAIQAVARAWEADPTVAPYLPVQLDPSCTLVGSAVRRPHRTELALAPDEERLVALLGTPPSNDNPMWTVERLLVASGQDAEAAAATLDRLRDARILRIGFRVPICSEPERHLALQVAAVPEVRLRDRLAGCLSSLADARAAAAGDVTDPVRVLGNLTEVDARLADAAGQAVRPGPGLAPGGRTPVYLDCRADLDAVVGDDAIADLAAPLSILLDSARWLTGQVGEIAAGALAERYRRLAARRAEVTLADLQLAAADVLVPGADWLAEVAQDFQLRWAEILPGAQPGAVCAVPVQRARQLADVLFPPTGRIWAAGRLHTPDLMLRRAADGSLRWVLGELHVALNTLESRFFATQADDPAELVAAQRASVAAGRVVPVYPTSATEISSRSYPPLSLDPPGRYRYWSYGGDDGHASGVRSTPGTALVVTERGGDLVATCQRDGWQAPVLECYGEFLSALVVNLFRLRSAEAYAPRVDLGALTICRRTWRFTAAEFGALPSHAAQPGQDRLRGWAAAQGLPRHVFARTPVEPKPFYVDFAAPLLVDNLARAIRRAVRGGGSRHDVEIVEMLPGPEELWLRLPDGSTRTSEFRFVAVDPAPAPPPSWQLGRELAGSGVG
jgi:hypothetical protein